MGPCMCAFRQALWPSVHAWDCLRCYSASFPFADGWSLRSGSSSHPTRVRVCQASDIIVGFENCAGYQSASSLRTELMRGPKVGSYCVPPPPPFPRGAPRTHHRQGGGSKEAGATTHSKGAGGQGAARDAVDPDVPYTREGKKRERASATRASPSARGSCEIQRVTQPLPPVAYSLGGPGLAPGHSGSNQPTNQPTPHPSPPPPAPSLPVSIPPSLSPSLSPSLPQSPLQGVCVALPRAGSERAIPLAFRLAAPARVGGLEFQCRGHGPPYGGLAYPSGGLMPTSG